MAKKQKSKAKELSGLVFIGCMFIGLAVGIFYNQTAMGVLAGLGVGFIASAIIKLKC